METLKIAMLAPEFLPNWGGAGTYSILLARELSKTDEIHVFTTLRSINGHLAKRKKEIEEYFQGRVKIILVSAARETFFYNAIYQFNVARNLPRIIKREKYDIIHSNHAHMPDLGLKLRRLDSNSITTVHTTLSSQFRGIKSSRGLIKHLEGSEKMVLMGYPFLSVLEKYYLGKSENLIFVSDFIKKEAEGLMKRPAKRSLIVRNGVDTEYFSCPDKDNENGKINIMFCGRLLALKGLNHLLDAFTKVHKEYPTTHLTLVGGGDIAQWKKTASASGVPPKAVTFMGQRSYEDMPGIIRQADIFVLPSMSESMPLSLLEAMACGRPSVASGVGGIPEIISNNENGFLVRPGDVGELAGRLGELVRNPDLRHTLGKKAREHAVKEFNIVDMVKETRDMFCTVAGGS